MVDVVIRRARPGDAEEIGKLWAALVAHHHELDPALPAAAADGPQRYARAVGDHLRSPSTAVWVAELDGRVVGYALGMVADMISSFFAHEPTGFIADLFVSPACRRSGIGRRLVAALMDWFAGRGVQKYEWHVAARNEDAQAFWRALGGAPVLVRMHAERQTEGT